MKKFLASLIALLAIAFATVSVTSCEMTYDEDYEELIQYWCCWGNATGSEWNEHSDPAKTLMIYDAGTNTYSIEVETKVKNCRFEITKGASYSLEYCYYNKNTDKYSQNEENKSLFPKYMDNGFGSSQTVLPTVGTYIITFDPVTETYSVANK